MPWILCPEEVSHQRIVWECLSAHVNERLPWDNLDQVVFDRKRERHTAIVSRAHFFLDIDLKKRFRIDPRIGKVSAQWHNVEIFGIPPCFFS